jgi:ABC-2 type transport system permease protein
LLSPLQAIRPLSAALAASDQHAHRRFLEQADVFRYAVIQRLNRDIIRNRKPAPVGTPTAPYVADVAAITRGMAFVPRSPPLGEVLIRHSADLLILAGWALAAILLAFAAGHRLARISS